MTSDNLAARVSRITNDSVVEGGAGSDTPLAIALANVTLTLPAGTAYVEVVVTPAAGATVFWEPGTGPATAADSIPIPPLGREIYDVGPDDPAGDPVVMNFISDNAVASAVRVLVVAG